MPVDPFAHTKSIIEEVGWAVVFVGASPTTPAFGYTIGLFSSFGQPELVMVGLQPGITQTILNNLGQSIKESRKSLPVGKDFFEVFNTLPARLLPVEESHYNDYVGIAIRYYNQGEGPAVQFPLLQCVWPDTNGVFPWQEGFNENFRATQPILVNNPELFD